jgi:hypothetical protein
VAAWFNKVKRIRKLKWFSKAQRFIKDKWFSNKAKRFNKDLSAFPTLPHRFLWWPPAGGFHARKGKWWGFDTLAGVFSLQPGGAVTFTSR